MELIEKTFKVTSEDIKLLASLGGFKESERLKERFPEVFETVLEVGKVYKNIENRLFLFKLVGMDQDEDSDYINGYGFNYLGNYFNAFSGAITNGKGLIEATEQEWKYALIAEAKKRGFKKGIYVNGDKLFFNKGLRYIEGNYEEFSFFGEGNSNLQCYGVSIFEKGEWAEIIPTMTLKEAEEKLNCKII